MLSSFSIRNFKSYREATLHLSPLTVLVGANASGKSNLVEALWLLSRMAKGNTLAGIRRELRDEHGPVRGKMDSLGYRGSDRFALACGTRRLDWDRYDIEIAIPRNGGTRVCQESLTGPVSDIPLFKVVSPSVDDGILRVAYKNFTGGESPQIICSSGMPVLAQLESPARFAERHTGAQATIPQITRYYLRWFSEIFFLHPNPADMRRYGSAADPELGERGSNLSGALFDLCERGEKERLLDFVRELPEQNIHDIDFIHTPRGEVMVSLEETFGGKDQSCDAALLSDGTLRVLAIAAAMLSAKEQSLVVIEEIDNGVHPSRARSLLQKILAIARERDLRVLISTHNPALLDALPEAAIPDVTFCYRNPEDGASCLLRLQDMPDYPDLVAQGPVGALMTAGLLDRFAKNPRNEEERIAESLAWLEGIR